MKPVAALRDRIRLIAESGLLDEQWYLSRYPDVREVGIDPAEHYVRIGARLLRDPGPGFDTAYYLRAYPDVVRARHNPLLHYIVYGRDEGRRCLPPSKPGTAKKQGPETQEQSPAGTRFHLALHAGRRKRDPRRKTILVCAHVAGQRMFGGERSLLDVVDGLAQLDYNVVVAIPGAGNPAYVQSLLECTVAVVSMRYGWWRKRVPIDEQAVAAFAHVISEHAIDAVHANTIMLREPLAAARRMGIPAVLHAREIITHDEALCQLIGEESSTIVDEVIDASDWVIANSEATARCFPADGCTAIVPNTVDVDAFDLASPEAGGVVRIAMISSNLPKKGILDFIEVAQILAHKVDNARFVLIGPDNEHTVALGKRQKSGELPSNIEFAGYRKNAVDAMREADIVLSLSHFRESFGRTVLEAMAARRPVVAYDWGAVPELVRDGETGFIVPYRDVSAVAERLQLLCGDRRKIRAMGEAGRARAVDLYAKPHFVRSLGAAYDAIFTRQAASGARRMVLSARNGAGKQRAPLPLRIAYFLWHFPVPSETFVLNELRILVEQGHDVHVYCRQSPHPDFKPDFSVSWTRVDTPNELCDRLKEAGRTIVHSHFTYPTVTEMVWPACEKAGIPFTFIAHAQDIFRHTNDSKNRIGEIGRSPNCLRVVVPSHYHRHYLESRGVPPEKLFINPNGIAPELYSSGRDADRAGRSRRSICAIHRFTEKKGLENLISAGKALEADAIQIHLYGYGELENRYRDLVADMCLENVHIHGAIQTRSEMLEVFNRHDLFACPSVRAADGDMDGIPTVLMEAMASGLPVLATAVSGIPDLVRNDVTGIVCEPESESIVRAIRRYYALPETKVKAIIEDALSLVQRKFNVAQLTSSLLKLWQQQPVDVMIVSWNNKLQLQEVIHRLQKFTQMPFHLVVCDNGSSYEVLAYLCHAYATFENMTVILNRENAYVGPGTNICLEHGLSDYAVYVCGKEGFVLDYGWEKGLVEYMDAHPDIGLAGTLCHSPSYLTGAQYPEGIPLFPKFRNPEFARENEDREFAHIQGGFFVMRRTMYEQIGGFSEAVPHNYTDVEYSYYVESHGWKLGTPPGLLALFNKTRPGLFSRIDESVAATHPPVLNQLPLLDRIVRSEVVYCNICDWNGDSFMDKDGLPSCPDCGSHPSDRSLYRFLAESTLTHRRLPAFGVGVGEAMTGIWKKQFQGALYSEAELQGRLDTKGRTDFNSGSMKLVYLNFTFPDAIAGMIREVNRILDRDGVVVLRVENDDSRALAAAGEYGLGKFESVRFSSQVLRYDSVPLHVGCKIEVPPCVS